MNTTTNKFLLAAVKFMPEMYMRQPGLTYSACRPITKNKKIQKFKETEDSRYIYQNELDKTCYQHDITHIAYKDLPRRTASERMPGKAFAVVSNQKYAYCGRAPMFFKFYDKKYRDTTTHTRIRYNFWE